MASGRIKGITIEIGGDTTSLTKSLSEVDRAVKDTQANLRDINKALKFDSGNVELLKLKQDNLNDSVDEAKRRLQAEKDALEQLKNSDGFDENSKAAKDLQTQIALDEVELKKAEDALKSFGSVGEQQMKLVGEKVKDVGNKISSLGEGMTKLVTGPIVAIGAGSVAAWQEVDGAMDIVIQKTGATGDALTDMQNRVTSIAETIPTSFEEAGTAIGEVNTRFGLTGDALEQLSTQFIEFANLNGTDVNSSIDTVQKTLAAFGLSAEDAGALLDTLNKAGQDSGISMDQLAQLMTSNATAFRSMGLNAADAANLLATLEKSGVDTSVAITGLTKVQKEAAEEGVSMETALNTALTDVNSAIEIFGSKAGVKLYESFQNGTLSVQDFTTSTASLTDALGSVSETYTATLDPLDQMTTTMNTLKSTGAEIVNSAAPMLEQAMKALADVVKQLSDAWNNLSPEQQEMIIQMAAVAAAVGPVLVVIGKVVTAVGGIITTLAPLGTLITGTIIPAIAAVGAPVLAIVAAVTAVIAVIVLCIKHWDEIKAKAEEVGKAISDKWNEVKTNITTAVTNIMTAVKEKFEQIKTDAVNKVTDLKNKVVTAFNNLKNSIASTVGNIKDSIVNGFQNAINFITSIPSRAIGWGRDIINGLVEGIRSAISKITDVMGNVADTIASFIHFSEPDRGSLANFHTFMPDMMKQLAQGITRGIPTIESAMDAMTRSMVPSMGNMAANAGTTNNDNSTNTVTLNVYGAQGQDVTQLANEIQNIINEQVYSKGAVFA